MKLQIKTIGEKSLMVDIEETKTVYDLKKELSWYAEVGVSPKYQKLIYDGKILNNNDQLSTYNIDVEKYLVITILKHPFEEPSSIHVAEEKQNFQDIPSSSNASPADVFKVEGAECLKAEDNATSSAAQGSDIDDMVKKITSMCVSEEEVRDALKACSNNPNLAIPLSSLNLEIDEVIDMGMDRPIAPSEFCHRDEAFINMRQALFQNSELLNACIHQIAESNPVLSNLLGENQEDLLAMLMKHMSDEANDDKAEHGGE